MNDGSPHELSAAYALDALDGNELRAYEAHLAGCERCRDDVATFRETASVTIDGKEVTKRVNHTLAIGSLGGATMDNEWNYVQAKLMRALGVVAIENQARI